MAEDELDHYRGEATDGWSDEVTSICWGEIRQRATVVSMDEHNDGSDGDYVDYVLQGLEIKK